MGSITKNVTNHNGPTTLLLLPKSIHGFWLLLLLLATRAAAWEFPGQLFTLWHPDSDSSSNYPPPPSLSSSVSDLSSSSSFGLDDLLKIFSPDLSSSSSSRTARDVARSQECASQRQTMVVQAQRIRELVDSFKDDYVAHQTDGIATYDQLDAAFDASTDPSLVEICTASPIPECDQVLVALPTPPHSTPSSQDEIALAVAVCRDHAHRFAEVWGEMFLDQSLHGGGYNLTLVKQAAQEVDALVAVAEAAANSCGSAPMSGQQLAGFVAKMHVINYSDAKRTKRGFATIRQTLLVTSYIINTMSGGVQGTDQTQNV